MAGLLHQHIAEDQEQLLCMAKILQLVDMAYALYWSKRVIAKCAGSAKIAEWAI